MAALGERVEWLEKNVHAALMKMFFATPVKLEKNQTALSTLRGKMRVIFCEEDGR
jgi:hypothetical protein